MDAYSRALVMFAHAALRSDRRWEAFCFGTRLTRITRQLEGSDADEALSRAAAEVVDWDGGTRIGESLKRFLDEYGHGGLHAVRSSSSAPTGSRSATPISWPSRWRASHGSPTGSSG